MIRCLVRCVVVVDVIRTRTHIPFSILILLSSLSVAVWVPLLRDHGKHTHAVSAYAAGYTKLWSDVSTGIVVLQRVYAVCVCVCEEACALVCLHLYVAFVTLVM